MVSRSTTIQFVFSEPMNPSSVLYLFSPTITFNTPVWSNGNTTLTLTPTSPLAFATMYAVTFTGQDVAGNAMSPPYSYGFTTEAMADTMPPTIVSSQPAEGATDVPVTTSLLVTFSEPMNRGSVTVGLMPAATLTAPVWANNDTELSLGVMNPLQASTNYRFTVNGNDLAGNALAAPSIAFTTAMPPDLMPPSLTGSTPMNAATAVPVTTRLSFTFSERMNPASLSVDATPNPGLGAATWSMNDQTVSIAQGADWPTSTNVVVSVDARDVAGNPLPTATLTFTTAAPPDMTRPTVASTVPDTMATGVPRGANIEFNFSEPMNRAATEAAFSSNPAITCVFTWNTAGTLMSCNPSVDLNASATYTITLGTGARDVANNTLASAYVFSFGTAAAPDNTRPTITTTAPANNAVGVSRSSGSFFNQTPTAISVTFSEAMSQASVQGSFSITSPSGFNGGTFSWNRNTMTYVPPAYFAYGQQVTFQVGAGASDLAGNTLAAPYNGTFRIRRRTSGTFTNAASSAALDGYITGSASCSSATFSAGSSVAPAGDSNSNQIYRGYLTFSLSPLSSLANVAIVSATLYTEQTGCTGNPFVSTFGGAIEAWHVDYGPSLDLGDCATANLGSRQYTLSSSTTLGQRSAGVSAAVQDDWTNRMTRGFRSQFQLRTATLVSDTDGAYDYCSQGTYNASSTNRPYLSITYEYD
jgi:hypothetical protein